MIIELVTFNSPEGMDRDAIAAQAREVVSHWQANKELVRKHFFVADDGTGGGLYLWPSIEAAKRGHDETWKKAVEKRTGSTPQIRYLDLFMIIDNDAGTVTEWAEGAAFAEGKALELEPAS